MAEIRRLQPEDLHEAAKIAYRGEFAGFEDMTTEDVLRQMKAGVAHPLRVLMGAVDESHLAAVAMMKFALNERTALVNFLVTRPEDQRQGHATRLLEALEAEAAELGAKAISMVPTRGSEEFLKARGFNAPGKGGGTTMSKRITNGHQPS